MTLQGFEEREYPTHPPGFWLLSMQICKGMVWPLEYEDVLQKSMLESKLRKRSKKSPALCIYHPLAA